MKKLLFPADTADGRRKNIRDNLRNLRTKYHSVFTVVLKVLSAISLVVLALYDILAVVVLVVDASRGGLPTSTDGEIGLFWEYLGGWANIISGLFVFTMWAFLILVAVVIYKLITKNFKVVFFLQIFFMVVWLYLFLGSLCGYPILWMLLD